MATTQVLRHDSPSLKRDLERRRLGYELLVLTSLRRRWVTFKVIWRAVGLLDVF
jgi:hypothetical protein